MRRALIAAFLLMLLGAPALAQTATPTPTPTGSSAQATLNALPTYDALGGSPTHTPFPTVAWPTLTPGSLAPVPWPGVGAQDITPGGPYRPPDAPNLISPGEDAADGFQAISGENVRAFLVYLVDGGMNLFQWFAVNNPELIRAARWLVIIMMVLFGMFFIWTGRRYQPPGADSFRTDRRARKQRTASEDQSAKKGNSR